MTRAKYGDGGSIFDPDHSTSLDEVVADIRAEERVQRVAERLNDRGATGIVNVKPHTLNTPCLRSARWKAHHFTVTQIGRGRWDKKLGLFVRKFCGVCKQCGGIDEWTNGEYDPDWADSMAAG